MKKWRKLKSLAAFALAVLMMLGTVHLPAHPLRVYAEASAASAAAERTVSGTAEAPGTGSTAESSAASEAGASGVSTEAAETGSAAETAPAETSSETGTTGSEESASKAGTESEAERAAAGTGEAASPGAESEAPATAESGAEAGGEAPADVLIHAKKEIHIRIGAEFHFCDDLAEDEEADSDDWVSYVTGPEADGKVYRAAIKSVETPEGGSYTFDEDHYEVETERFTPVAEDAGLTYTITWKAQVRADDGSTWEDLVADNEAEESYQTKLIVDAAEASPSEVEETDAVSFTAEAEMTAYVGEAFLLTDEAVISVTGPAEDGETYRPVVAGIETPAGGSYTYADGDERFTPAEADIGLVYIITYGAEKRAAAEASWEKVPDAEFVMHVTVDKKHIRRRRTPIYSGLVSELAVDMADEYYTGQFVTAAARIAVNGTSTVDEPFILEISLPKAGIYGPDATEDARYRLHTSEFAQSLETTLTADADNYLMRYKFQPGSDALVFSVPLSFKFVRTGLVPDGTTYTVTLRVKDMNGNLVRDTDKTVTLKLDKPEQLKQYIHADGSYNDESRVLLPNSTLLNLDGTALKNDVSAIPHYTGIVPVLPNQAEADSQGDEIGIRKASRIVDTYTLPDIAYVDTSRLPAGAAYDPVAHTITRTIENTVSWLAGTERAYSYATYLSPEQVYIKLPGAVIGQDYRVKLSREYQFDDVPAENFTLNAPDVVMKYTVSNYRYNYILQTHNTQSLFSDTGHDNRIDWNSNPWVQTDFRRLLSTNDPNPTANLAPTSIEGVTISNDEIDPNLVYQSVVLNPEANGAPSTFSGTLRVEGVRADGTTVTIADHVSYPVGSSTMIPVTGDFQKVRVIANADAAMKAVLHSGVEQGCAIRFAFGFKAGLDSNTTYVFKGRVNKTRPAELNETCGHFSHPYSYSTGHNDSLHDDYAAYGGTHGFNYYFLYQPERDTGNGFDNYDSYVLPYGIGNSQIGDEFTVRNRFRMNSVSTVHPTMEDGKLRFTLPVGYELIEGSENVELAGTGSYEKDVAQILASRTGPVSDGARKYYEYDIGDVSGLGVGHIVVGFSARIRHTAYHPEIGKDTYSRAATIGLQFAETSRTFDDLTKYNTSTSGNWSLYIVKAETKTTSYKPSWSYSAQYFNDIANDLTTASQRTDAFSGQDYYHDEIGLAVKIGSVSAVGETYTGGGILDLNLPEGLEIVDGSEMLTDPYGRFTSDKSLAEIIASRTGDRYDLGKATMTAGSNWDLTLRLKVRVTENLLVGTTYFEPKLTLTREDGRKLIAKETVGQYHSGTHRKFNYVPANGFVSALTGHDTTEKERVGFGRYGNNLLQYEYRIGNYTGQPVQNVTIIDFLPGVGDIDGKGNARNSELTPKFYDLSAASNFRIYYSNDEPIPGMTAAEYDGVADWTISYGNLGGSHAANAKAIKLVSTGAINTGFVGNVATLRMYIPESEANAENQGKIVNNSFSVKYQVGTLNSNFVESNVKPYEARAMVVHPRVFIDLNRNNVYDEGDRLYNGSLSGSYDKDGTAYNWSPLAYNWENGGGYVPQDLYLPEEGRYSFRASAPHTYLQLCQYGPGENQSNLDEATGQSQAFDLSYDGTSEITLNIGFQYNGVYEVKYDLNGGHDSRTGETAVVDRRMPGASFRIGDLNMGSGTVEPVYPYHMFAGWNTNSDGSGTSYTRGQQITGGFPVAAGETVTLYAQWIELPQTYIVRYHRGGPEEIITGAMADDTVTVGAGYTLKNSGFTHSAGIFGGWNTAKNGSGDSYYEGQYVGDLWDGDASYWTGYGAHPVTEPIVIDLYAMWKQDLYTFKAADATSGWDGAVENPDHPLTGPDDAQHRHPNNYAAKYPIDGVRFRITKINGDGSEGDQVSAAISQAQGQLYFHDMLPGQYYLIEENTPDGYMKVTGKWKITVTVDSFTGDLVISGSEKTDRRMRDMDSYSYYMKSMNCYVVNEKAYYHNVSLSTQISDENIEYASIDQNFRYRITILDRTFQPIANETFHYTGGVLAGVTGGHPAPADGSFTTDEQGRAYVILKHGQKIDIHNVFGTSKVSIYQMTEGGDVYTQIDGAGFGFTPSRAVSFSIGGVGGSDVAVDYKIMNFIPVPAGIEDLNNKAILIGSCAAIFLALGGFLLRRRRRRKRRKPLT